MNEDVCNMISTVVSASFSLHVFEKISENNRASVSGELRKSVAHAKIMFAKLSLLISKKKKKLQHLSK